jgi:ribosomal protein S18 acetylase RimI-like enzyme
MPEPHLREPAEADHPAMVAAIDAWWGARQGAGGSERLAALLPRVWVQHFSDTSLVLEHDDGRLAAFLIGFLSPARTGEAYIHFVGVDPALRRGGVAAGLYRRFFDLAAARGAHTVSCVTSPGNAASLAFHRVLGFEVEPSDDLVDGVPVQRDYDGPGLHRVVLHRALPAPAL